MVVAGGDKFNHKWEKAIIGLLTKPDLATAAEFANISVNTLLRWLNIPEFAQKYSDAKREVLKQALSKLQQASGEAVETLKEVCGDATASSSARVTAAKSIIEMSVKVAELDEIEKRLTELERVALERVRDEF